MKKWMFCHRSKCMVKMQNLPVRLLCTLRVGMDCMEKETIYIDPENKKRNYVQIVHL